MLTLSDDLEAGLVSYNVSTIHDAADPQDASVLAPADDSYNLEVDGPDGDSGAHEPRSLLLKSVHDHPESEEPNETHRDLQGAPVALRFEIEQDELVGVVRDRNLQALNNRYDGAGGLSSLLKTDLEKGIEGSDDEILQRTEAFGSNTYPCNKGKTFWSFIWKATQFLLYPIILLAAVISSLLQIKRKAIHDGFYVEACIISATVLDIIVRAFIEYKRCRQSEKTREKNRSVPQDVIRGGRRFTVSSSDIVVGDIVPLRNGFQVPADGVLFDANSLTIDEQELIGSPLIVQKDILKDPFLLSGSKVIEGIGTMLVTSVGINTEWGKKIPEIDEENRVQVYVKRLAILYSLLVILVAFVACVVQLCRYFYGWTKKPDGTPMYMPGSTTSDDAMKYVIKSLSFGIETIIVAVPVGLRIGVVLNHAFTTRIMMTVKALVQKLSAYERMGHVTTIVCHQTGILTLNQMSVVDAWAGGIRMQDMDNVSQLPSILKKLIIEGIARNTNGSVVSEMVPEVYGSPTEQAILSWGNKWGMKFDEARSGSLVLHVTPFNPKKKFGGVALKVRTEHHVHWKGSAKVILKSCKWYMDGANNRIAIDKQEMERIRKDMCKRGMRCAALAYRSYEPGSLPAKDELYTLPQDLVLLAIIGIEDPFRPGTKDAVKLSNSGGVKVRMVTEDDALTARAIAKDCGILENSDGPDVIMTGAQFLGRQDREEIAPKILVLAQASPQDSLLFVEALKRSGDVVAATGMGIHDTKTLRAADVSLAMGIGGTAEARENSDIIILDDSFATIVKVIQAGRSLDVNTLRYVLFRLTVSLTALAICVVVVVLYDAFPLNPVQILLLNFVLDIFGALALAYRLSDRNLMRKPPVGIRDHLITKTMWIKMVMQVIYLVQLALMHDDSVLKLDYGHTNDAVDVKNTFIFNALVFCLVINEVEIPNRDQTLKEVLRDNVFVVTITATVIVHIILVAPFGISYPAIRFDWLKWLVSIFLGFISQIATRPTTRFP